VHVRTAPAIRTLSPGDTVTLLRRHVGGSETIQQLVLLPNAEGIDHESECAVTLTPNPFTNTLHIRVADNSSITSCTIIDGAGEVAWKMSAVPGTTQLVWNGCSEVGTPLSSGVFTLIVSTGTCQVTRRVVKVH
jgi:hypothetical protein